MPKALEWVPLSGEARAKVDREMAEKDARREEKRQQRLLQFEAYRVMHNARKSGALKKASVCSRCGDEPPPAKMHAHHEDYTKPLEVEWMCDKCHRALHLALKAINTN